LLDGKTERLTGGQWAIKHAHGKNIKPAGDAQVACTFRTKRDAQEFIRENYGYIARRADLRKEPHGWRMPLPVKVLISVERTK